MQLEEDSNKALNINLDLLSIENLPTGDITIKKLFELKKIEIIYDEKVNFYFFQILIHQIYLITLLIILMRLVLSNHSILAN